MVTPSLPDGKKARQGWASRIAWMAVILFAYMVFRRIIGWDDTFNWEELFRLFTFCLLVFFIYAVYSRPRNTKK